MTRNASRLAKLAPPADTPAPIATVAAEAVARAYVSTFRLVVLICGLLATVSGLVAWLSLAPDKGVSGRTAATHAR